MDSSGGVRPGGMAPVPAEVRAVLKIERHLELAEEKLASEEGRSNSSFRAKAFVFIVRALKADLAEVPQLRDKLRILDLLGLALDEFRLGHAAGDLHSLPIWSRPSASARTRRLRWRSAAAVEMLLRAGSTARDARAFVASSLTRQGFKGWRSDSVLPSTIAHWHRNVRNEAQSELTIFVDDIFASTGAAASDGAQIRKLARSFLHARETRDLLVR